MDMLEEAACELFFERGYAQTSVADITQRAGVSRATFFNYVGTKSDLLWVTVDEALSQLAGSLGPLDPERPLTGIRQSLSELAAGLQPCTVVLALANADIMGLAAELNKSSAERQQRLAEIIVGPLRGCGWDQMRAEVVASCYAGAFLAALRTWSRSRPGQTNLTEFLEPALRIADGDGPPRP